MSTDVETMKKYRATFTVTKSFEAKVVFEAPNDQVAKEMANDMADDDFVADRADEDSVSVDSVSLDVVSYAAQNDKADRSVQRWCESWRNDREEDE